MLRPSSAQFEPIQKIGVLSYQYCLLVQIFYSQKFSYLFILNIIHCNSNFRPVSAHPPDTKITNSQNIINNGMQNKQNTSGYPSLPLSISLPQKLQSCIDDLSMLLDLIYKFPQSQREKYYDRIQLLKQNIMQLKVCVKECQTPNAMVAIQKKYVQIYGRVNQLKIQINGGGSHADTYQNKKKKQIIQGLSNQIASRHEQKQMNRRGIEKAQYQQIMQTIVSKQQQIKKYKQQLQHTQHLLTQYQCSSSNSQQQVQSLQAQLVTTVTDLQQQHAQYAALNDKYNQMLSKLQILEEIHAKLQGNLGHLQVQNSALRAAVQQFANKDRDARVQIERTRGLLAAFQEKYRFDVRDLTEREESARTKQRILDKKVRDLQKQLQASLNAHQLSKQLATQNNRIKQDLKVLQSQLSQKQQILFEKNKKIQSQKSELALFKNLVQQKEKQLKIKQHQIEELITIQKESQAVLTILERRIRQMESFTAEMEENKLGIQRRLVTMQTELGIRLSQLKDKDEKLRQTTLQLNSCQLSCNQLQIQHQNLKQTLQSASKSQSLEQAILQSKLQELQKIQDHLLEQKSNLQRQFEKKGEKLKEKEQTCRKLQKQIINYKKRLLRAKIQTLHDVREVLV